MSTSPPPLPKLPAREPDSHKGTFGRVLIVGGSRGMAGAAALSGMAALRSGAGLVRLAVAESCLETIAAFEPSYMTVPLPADAEGRLAAEFHADLAGLLPWATAVAIGPGLGRSPQLDRLVVELYRHTEQVLVVDADALNALSDHRNVLADHAGPRILTPHPGEMARLVGCSTGEIQADRERHAGELAEATGAVVVLKGHQTVIAGEGQLAINTTGNPGMATGGSGDVLTGITVAIAAQGLAAYDAARLATYVHGLAGDVQAEQLGMVSLIARDLIDGLPAAFKSLT
jgi:ADP-dependent NAD(P)H-hydrate dehydratase